MVKNALNKKEIKKTNTRNNNVCQKNKPTEKSLINFSIISFFLQFNFKNQDRDQPSQS